MIAQLGYKFLALLITVGVFSATGYLPYSVVGYVLLFAIMYIYITSKDTEDMLFRILLLITVYFTVSYVFTYTKEGFYITPSRLISHSMTAKQCQDMCESNKHCKFANVPLGTSRSGRRTTCWNSYGQGQRAYGSSSQGGDTWQNKNYVQPPPPPPPPKPRMFRNGEYIAIRNYRGQWLAADPRGKHDQIGYRPWRQTWETFQVLHHPNGNPDHYLIKSIHGKWLIFNSGWRWHRDRRWYRVYFHNFGSRRPTKNWTWEIIEFKKKSNGRWGIYNPHHRRYMDSAYQHQSIAKPWHRLHEEFRIYKVPTAWGRGSREWQDKELGTGKYAVLPLVNRRGRYQSYNPPFRTRGSRGGTYNKLGRCEGDCDSDSQCMPGLKCKQRNGYERVPGCTGRGSRVWDYCYDPKS